MKIRKILHLLIPAGMVLTAIFILGGCASKKHIWGNTKKGLILSYRMAENQPYTYKMTGDVAQTLKINEQKLEVIMNSYQEYTFTPISSDSDPISFKVTIDTMSLYIKTPLQEMEPGMENVIGKSIEMKLSGLGEESDYGEASEIIYAIGSETRNLGVEFQGFFPNLPGKPVQVGDSWSYRDTITEESGGNWLTIYADNTAMLEGYETLGSRECARIVVLSTGTIAGKGHTQGVDTETAGEFTGADKVYFDYKAGVLVKIVSEGVVNSTTLTSGMRQMTIPATREMVEVVTLAD